MHKNRKKRAKLKCQRGNKDKKKKIPTATVFFIPTTR